MADNEPKGPTGGTIGLMLGGLLALAAMVFIVSGGHLGGVKEIRSDAGCTERRNRETSAPARGGTQHQHRVARRVDPLEQLADEHIGSPQRVELLRSQLFRRCELTEDIGAEQIRRFDQDHALRLPRPIERAQHRVRVLPDAER